MPTSPRSRPIDPQTQAADPVIMGHNENNEWYSGLLDEIALLKVALSKDNLKTIINKGLENALAVRPSGKLAQTWASIKAQ